MKKQAGVSAAALAKGKKISKKEQMTDDPYKMKSGGGLTHVVTGWGVAQGRQNERCRPMGATVHLGSTPNVGGGGSGGYSRNGGDTGSSNYQDDGRNVANISDTFKGTASYSFC